MRLYDAGCRVEKHVRQVQRTRGHFMGVTEPFDRRQVLVAQVQPATGYRRIPQLCDAALIGTSGSSCAQRARADRGWADAQRVPGRPDLDHRAGLGGRPDRLGKQMDPSGARVQRVARADGCIWSCELRTGSAVDVMAPLERFKA